MSEHEELMKIIDTWEWDDSPVDDDFVPNLDLADRILQAGFRKTLDVSELESFESHEIVKREGPWVRYEDARRLAAPKERWVLVKDQSPVKGDHVLVVRPDTPTTVRKIHLVQWSDGDENDFEWWQPSPGFPAPPQEGELTREWLSILLPDAKHVSGAIFDAILTRHQQALSDREQAVRGKMGTQITELGDTILRQDSSIDSLRAELAAEKLANEGPRWGDTFDIVAGGIRSRVQLVALNLHGAEQDASIWYIPSAVDEVDWKPKSTLTPAEKAEALVKWWCEKEGYKPESLGWKELATRQANGETIDQIYAEVEGRKE